MEKENQRAFGMTRCDPDKNGCESDLYRKCVCHGLNKAIDLLDKNLKCPDLEGLNHTIQCMQVCPMDSRNELTTKDCWKRYLMEDA